MLSRVILQMGLAWSSRSTLAVACHWPVRVFHRFINLTHKRETPTLNHLCLSWMTPSIQHFDW